MSILSDLAEMGENLEATDTLIAETLTFELSTTDDISRALQVEQFGREIVESNPSAVDTVEPKCAELARVTSHFRTVIQEKIAKQKEWRDVQFTIEKVVKELNYKKVYFVLFNVIYCWHLSGSIYQFVHGNFCLWQANRICTEGMDLMTSPIPETTEDCPDVGTSVLLQIDNFLDKIQPMLDELQSLKTNLKSPTSSQSKTLVKQVKC